MAIYNEIFQLVDISVENYIETTSLSVISYITPIFTSLFILTIVIWGYLLIMGRSQAPLEEVFSKMLRVGFIMTFALTAGIYSSVVVEFLNGWHIELAGVLNTNNTAPEKTSVLLDAMLAGLQVSSDIAWQKGGILAGNFGMYVIWLVITVFGFVFTLIIAFQILLSKILLSILLGIGPLFIMLVLFDATKRFFEAWIGLVLNYGFLLFLSVAIGRLMVSFVDTLLTSLLTAASIATSAGALNLSIILGFAILIIKQVPQLASTLGGGISIQTSGAISNLANGRAGRAIEKRGRAVVNSAASGAASAYKKTFRKNSISSS